MPAAGQSAHEKPLLPKVDAVFSLFPQPVMI